MYGQSAWFGSTASPSDASTARILVALDSKAGPSRFHAPVASDGLPRTRSRIWVQRFQCAVTCQTGPKRRSEVPRAVSALGVSLESLGTTCSSTDAASARASLARYWYRSRFRHPRVSLSRSFACKIIAPDLFAALPERPSRSRLLRRPLRLVFVSSTEALLQSSGAHPQRLGAPSARDSVLLAQTNPWRLRE